MMTKGKRAVRRVREIAPAYVVGTQRLLLDTQVWLWWKAADSRLGREARAAIIQAKDVRFSAASAWEIAIKQSVGKLKLPYHTDLPAELAKHGFRPLPVEMNHASGVATLPLIHRDPFDRLLVAQAMAEGLTLVTADSVMSRYGIAVILATR